MCGRGVWVHLSKRLPARPSVRPSPGPDSPVSPLKERAQAGRRQQQALEARLEGCVQELRRLCLREAVSRVGGTPCPTPPHLRGSGSVSPCAVPRS